jgi:drug/metabolite transporter (DMT)-like permease
VTAIAVYIIAGSFGAAHLPPPPPSSPLDVGVLAWVVLVLICVGVIAWNYGVNRAGIVVAMLYLNLTPIVAIAITALLGTTPRPMQIAGGALVIAGVLQAQLRRLRGTAPVPAPVGKEEA